MSSNYSIIDLSIEKREITVSYTDTLNPEDDPVIRTLNVPLLDSADWQDELKDLLRDNYPYKLFEDRSLADEEPDQIVLSDSDIASMVGFSENFDVSVIKANSQFGYPMEALHTMEALQTVWVDSSTNDAFILGPNPVTLAQMIDAKVGTRSDSEKIGIRKITSLDHVVDFGSRREAPFIARVTTNSEAIEMYDQLKWFSQKTAETAEEVWQLGYDKDPSVIDFLAQRGQAFSRTNEVVYKSARSGNYKDFVSAATEALAICHNRSERVNFNMTDSDLFDSASTLVINSLFPQFASVSSFSPYEHVGGVLSNASWDQANWRVTTSGSNSFIQTDEIDYVSFHGDSLPKNLSVSVWFNGTATGDHRTLVNEGTHPLVNIIDDKFYVGTWDGSTDSASVVTDALYNSGSLQNVVVTHDGDRLAVYVDGALKGERSGVTRSVGDTNYFTIGGATTNDSANFGWSSTDNDLAGHYHMVRIFDSAMDSDLVVANYAWEHTNLDGIV